MLYCHPGRQLLHAGTKGKKTRWAKNSRNANNKRLHLHAEGLLHKQRRFAIFSLQLNPCYNASFNLWVLSLKFNCYHQIYSGEFTLRKRRQVDFILLLVRDLCQKQKMLMGISLFWRKDRNESHQTFLKRFFNLWIQKLFGSMSILDFYRCCEQFSGDMCTCHIEALKRLEQSDIPRHGNFFLVIFRTLLYNSIPLTPTQG